MLKNQESKAARIDEVARKAKKDLMRAEYGKSQYLKCIEQRERQK